MNEGGPVGSSVTVVGAAIEERYSNTLVSAYQVPEILSEQVSSGVRAYVMMFFDCMARHLSLSEELRQVTRTSAFGSKKTSAGGYGGCSGPPALW
jgi:hypothetical protein